MLPRTRIIAPRSARAARQGGTHVIGPRLQRTLCAKLPRMVQRNRPAVDMEASWPAPPAISLLLKPIPTAAALGLNARAGDGAGDGAGDVLHEARVSWAIARRSRIRVDPQLLAQPPQASDTSLASPWRTVFVPRSALRWLSDTDHTHERSHGNLWRIGANRPALNSNPMDIDGLAMQYELQSRRPGQGPFEGVVRGPYGERYSKYLFVIDHLGMHIVREMTPCDLSSRGIALHSLMREQAVVGGEIFFDMQDAGTAYVNFGSARFPVSSNYQAEKVAELVLAIGYSTVLAMIPEREFRQGEYGLGDRYGKDVENVRFRVAEHD